MLKVLAQAAGKRVLTIDLPLVDQTHYQATQTCPHCEQLIGDGLYIEPVQEADMESRGDLYQCPNCSEFYVVVDKPVFSAGITTVWTQIQVKE